MPKSLIRLLCLLAVVLAPLSTARAETPTPEAEAAARELISTMKLSDQFTALMPTIIKTLKPAIVQNRPEVERDFDALVPSLIQGMAARIDEFSAAVVAVYVSNFTADELRAASAFYHTPAGQKFLEKNPLVMQQTMTLGQKIGQAIGSEVRQKIVDEMRKKGHSI